MKPELSDEALGEIKQTFTELDADGCGGLDREQVREALRRFTFMDFPDDQIQIIMHYFDSDRNDKLDMDEFIKLLTKMK